MGNLATSGGLLGCPVTAGGCVSHQQLMQRPELLLNIHKAQLVPNNRELSSPKHQSCCGREEFILESDTSALSAISGKQLALPEATCKMGNKTEYRRFDHTLTHYLAESR